MITQSQAIVFVDGRYVTQLKEQVDGSVFTGGDLVGEPPHVWLRAPWRKKAFASVSIPGCTPVPRSASWKRRLADLAARSSSSTTIRSTGSGATGRPQPLGRVKIQPLDSCRRACQGQARNDGGRDLPRPVPQAVVLTDPSSIAWTFNIRGSDVPHTPHPLARAIVHADGSAELFLDKRKTGIEEEAYLTQLCKP